MTQRHRNNKRRERLSVVDVLEPRVLYSADALSGLLPLLFDDDAMDVDAYAVPLESTSEPSPATNHPVLNVVFIDEGVPESQDLIEALAADTTQIVVIGEQDDGLLVISQTLATHEALQSVQIVSHGEPGRLQLGMVSVDQHVLTKNQAAVISWADALAEDADLLLLGCDVAGDWAGMQLVNELARLTGADVAASTDATGHASLGGDWELEFRVGKVDAALALDAAAQQQWRNSLGTITVDTTVDEFDIDPTTTLDELLSLQAGGQSVSLREAIHAANQGPASVDTILLGPGDYKLTRSGNDDQSGDLDIRDDLLIRGMNWSSTSIEMLATNQRVFDVFGSNVEFDSVKIYGGDATGDGGGIRADAAATLILRNTLVTGNTADNDGGGIASDGALQIEQSAISGNVSNDQGGGVYAANAAVTIQNSTLHDNTSKDDGGALFAMDVELSDSTVVANTSNVGKGGGLFVSGALTASNFLIQDNTAKQDGGGVYAGGIFDFHSGAFSGNRSTSQHGGALYALDTGHIENVDFNANQADRSGGAVYTHQSLDLTDTGFNFNAAADSGGAVFAEDVLNVHDTGFDNNTAGDDGGAIYGEGPLTIERSSFTQNFASTGDGGALYLDDSQSLSVVSTTFAENVAVDGAAIYTDGPGSIANTTFADNSASGSISTIYADGSFVQVQSSVFSGNLENGSTNGVVTPQVLSAGFNIYDFLSSSTVNTDINDTDPRLDTLDAAGGRVKAYTLLSDSPAINAGRVDASVMTDSQGNPLDEFADIGASEYSSTDSVIFWSDTDGKIYRSSDDYANIQVFAEGRPGPSSLDVGLQQQRLYWLEDGNSRVMSAALSDSADLNTLVTGLVDARSVAVDSIGGHLYVSFLGSSPRIDRYDLNTGVYLQNVVSTGIAQPWDIEFSDSTQRIYWTDRGGAGVSISVRSASVDTGLAEYHYFALSPTGIAVNADGTELYAVDSTVDSVAHIDPQTNSLLGLYSVDADPGGVSVDKTTGDIIVSSDSTDRIVTLQHGDLASLAAYSHPSAVVQMTTTPTSASTLLSNAAPVVTVNLPLSVLEGGSGLIDNSLLASADPDSPTTDIRFTVVGSLFHGSLTVDGVTDQSSFTQQQLNDPLVEIQYDHDGRESSSESITFNYSDGIAAPKPVTFSIDVTAVNDAPRLNLVNLPLNVLEGGQLPLSTALLSASDADDDDADLVYRVSDMSNGHVEVDGRVLSNGQIFTGTELSAGMVRFQHDGSETSTAGLTVAVDDGSLVSAPAPMNITVMPLDDLPAWVSVTGSLQVAEGGMVPLTSALLDTTDPDNSDSDFAFRLVSLPLHGVVEINGVPMDSGDSFTFDQLSAGQVLYRHQDDDLADDSLSIVAFNAGAGTVPKLIDVTVSGVNDDPVLTLQMSTVVENIPGATAGLVEASDADLGDTVTLSVDDPRFTIEGNVLKLVENVALDFEQEPLVVLSVSASDSTGATTSQSVNLAVSDANDAPVLLIQPSSVGGDGYALPSGTFVDADGDTLAFRATLDDLQPLPPWLTFDSVNRQFTVSDESLVSPSLDVLIQVEDGRGGQSSVALTLSFDPPPAAANPVITPEPVPTPEPAPTLTPALTPEPAVESVSISEFSVVPPVSVSTQPLPETATPASNSVSTVQMAENLVIDRPTVPMVIVDEVDLQALIAPLPRFGALELAVLQESVGSSPVDVLMNSLELDVDSFDLADLLSLPPADNSTQSESLAAALDKQKEELQQQTSLIQALVGSSVGITTGLSAGYLLWLIRGGTLLGSVLSSLPAWRFVDPLPVLGSLADDIDDDDESLASMVDADEEGPGVNRQSQFDHSGQITAERGNRRSS